MLRTTTLLAAAALLAIETMAARQICYDRYNRAYYCNGGLSTGARIAIGVCVGIGVLLIFSLFGCMRRKKLQSQWKQYRPPPPVGMTGGTSANPYGANPPPPTYAGGASSGYARNDIGADTPAPPAATYQPSAANNYGGAGAGGQHGLASGYYGNNDNPSSEAQHSYEYEQQARMDAEKGYPPTSPPGYDMGGGPGTNYASPSGPPPGTGNNYASPAGPPPGK